MPSNAGSQLRRPALIPADAELSEQDVRSIKLRTGDAIPILPPEITKTTGSVGQAPNETMQVLNGNGKRKASTSAEDHQINNLTERIPEEQSPHSPLEDEELSVYLDKDTHMG